MNLVHFTPFPVLSTERLVLRSLTMNDAPELFLLRSDETVNQYLDRPKAKSIEDAESFIQKIKSSVEADQSLYWAISFQNQPSLIGTICLWNFSAEKNKAEMGYELLPQFQGKGIMQEALRQVLDFGFKKLPLQLIEAWTVAGNTKSIKILERNHFKKDHEAESRVDRTIESPHTVIYSLSKTDYLKISHT